jgi:hypothetical protein
MIMPAIKINRMDKWIESRITKLMTNGHQVVIVNLIREMGGFFALNLNPVQRKNLENRIGRIRERVKKRLQRQKRSIPALARQWMIDQRLVERWVAAGWLDLHYPKKIRVLTEMFREMDYVRMINPEEIPTDIDTKIWDKL